MNPGSHGYQNLINTHKERKVCLISLTNMDEKLFIKYSQTGFSKTSPQITPFTQSPYWMKKKTINAMYYINHRNHMIPLTDAEKAFDKGQHPFIIKKETSKGTEDV